MARVTYDHRQTALWFVLPIFVVVFGLLAVSVALDPENSGGIVGTVAVGLVFTALYGSFASLRVTIQAGDLHVRFQFGWPRRHIPIDAIESHEVVRNPWWYGWGIRMVPGGMLYSVWGRDCVAVTYDTGRRLRTLRIGTDDPKGLDRAITKARKEA